MYEIIWYGRGGQGVVLASQVLAEAAYIAGYRGITSAPTFGPERRGAPLTASTRIAPEPVRTFSQIEQADFAVVFDESLFEVMDIRERLKPGGAVIINTSRAPEEVVIEGCTTVAVIDAAAIAREQRLFVGGLPTVNTPLIGALLFVSRIVSLEHVGKGLAKKMSDDQAYPNFESIKIAYERTHILQER